MNNNSLLDKPLSWRLRPENFSEILGQDHILRKGSLFRRALSARRLNSLIIWGPPGSGKTSLGFIVARELEANFKYFNAAFTSVSQIKKVLEEARNSSSQRKTLIFIDEVHRFNRTQQEVIIPYTENAAITFIGATIHKPFYCLIPSLISRSLVIEFKPLVKEDILNILRRALEDKERGLGFLNLKVEDEALEYIASLCGGDARVALTALEIGALSTPPDKEGKIIFNQEVATSSIQKNIFYDRGNSYHYDTISAFIKSLRGSDVDSALYWLVKMLKAGEDIRFIARRLIIFASEDIGLACPFALVLATSTLSAVELVGLPEAEIILAEAVIYLASAPKSNSSYLALKKVQEELEKGETIEVPAHLKTHSLDYKYPHSFGGYVRQDYGVRKKFYFPKNSGEEKKIQEFLKMLKKR